MKIGLRIFLGYFLIVGLAGFFVMRVFVDEVKPGVRQAMEDTLVDTANALAELAAQDMRDGRMADGQFARSVDSLVKRDVRAQIWNFRKRSFDYRIYVTDAKGIVVYDSSRQAVGQDYSRWNDVYLTLQGRYGARSTRTDPDDDSTSVMHVAAPIRDGERIIGSLTVAKANQRIEPFIETSRQAILRQGWILLGLSFLIGIAVTWWLSRSLASLGRFARSVTAGERVEAPDLGHNEIGDLGRALATMRERLDGKQYVEQYVQTLAHEMKSPLAAIRGAAEILEDAPPGPDRDRFLRNIDTQAARLASMIDRMLALAALEYRQSLQGAEVLDLCQLLRECSDAAEPRLQMKQLQLDLRLEEATANISGDRFLLGQAIGNLLDNAIEFSPAGSCIVLAIEREPGTWLVRVEDSGPGIPEFAAERVFDRFYSLPRPDGSRSSGIGLSFVREVAALHGGSIELENRESGGAIARLRLPAR
ncbi:MAG: two-component system sensor histidine kinase CreC [Gammaproteobacteria bacterium]|nr:two-component system sensor histidine kinase CreC [Gammaproteobacteria bacterium]